MLTVTPRLSLRNGALAFLLLNSVAAAQAPRWAADGTDEPIGALPVYSVLLLDTLSQEHVVGTLFDLRRDFDIVDPPSRTIAVGGSFSDFQQFGEVLISFNEAVMYGSDGAVYAIGKSLTSEAHGLNVGGTIVGFAANALAGDYAAFRYKTKTWTTLPGLGGSMGNATAVNDLEFVVGYDGDGGGNSKAVYWTPDNQLRVPDLGDVSSEFLGVNNRNVAVGYAAVGPIGEHCAISYELANGHLTVLPFPFATNGGTYAQAINERGEVVGISSQFGAYQPVRWKMGNVTAMAVLPGEGTGGARANDINNHGVIVGNSNWGKAVIWLGGAIYDLNELTPGAPGFLTNAVAISDEGVIACHLDNGTPRAVLLVPQG